MRYNMILMYVISGFLFLLSPVVTRADAQPNIVAEGQANAQIVVAEQRERMETLAALELQYYIEKISGARLPITTEPSDTHPIKIYAGPSEHTARLGVTDEGLKHGAYRIVSGNDWLVLLGRDVDYSPPEPWPHSHGDIPRAEADFDELTRAYTDHGWGLPWRLVYKLHWKRRDRTPAMAERYGEENARWWPGGDFSEGYWHDDAGGTLNAVYGWLRTLGARWYMPGEIGEVLPEQKTIPLASFDRTVKPDFALRGWYWYNYSIFSFEEVMWARRLGLNGAKQLFGHAGMAAHGLVHVHQRESMKEAHPDYYALIDGERDTEHRGYGRPCFSSEGLTEETIAYARFMFDHYDEPAVSIWPVDGLRKCQCEKCADKSSSELVWGFVDRVARELMKTHPDRIVYCGAYTPYRDPPETIEKFTPNVAVKMANRGRPTFMVAERWEHYRTNVAEWRKRLAPNRLVRGDNSRYSLWNGADQPDPFPVIQANTHAKDLRMLKGISLGENAEQSQKGGLIHNGVNHRGLYVQARYLWDADQALEPLLAEYYEKFYGPARAQMKAAFEFAQKAYTRAVANSPGRGGASPGNVPVRDRIQLVKMLHAARETTGDTIYRRRINLIISNLQSLDELRRLQRE